MIEEEIDFSQNRIPIGKWWARLKVGGAVPMVRAASEVEYLAGSLHQYGRELEQALRDDPGLSELHESFAERLSLLDFVMDLLDQAAETAAAEADVAFFPARS